MAARKIELREVAVTMTRVALVAAALALPGVAAVAGTPERPAAARPPAPAVAPAPAAAPAAAAAPASPTPVSPAVPKVEAPAVPAASAPRKGLFDEDPYPLYDQGNRVDPFTLGKEIKVENPEVPCLNCKAMIPAGVLVCPRCHTPRAGTPVVRDHEGLLREHTRKYLEAELLLTSDKVDRFSGCADACQQSMQSIRPVIGEIESDPEKAARYLERFRGLLERLERLQATAARLKQRQAIEDEFSKLKIAVDGIVWRPTAPAAGVNGEVVGEGSIIKVGTAGQFVQVHRIRPDAVIFLFKGVQISMGLRN